MRKVSGEGRVLEAKRRRGSMLHFYPYKSSVQMEEALVVNVAVVWGIVCILAVVEHTWKDSETILSNIGELLSYLRFQWRQNNVLFCCGHHRPCCTEPCDFPDSTQCQEPLRDMGCAVASKDRLLHVA